MMLLGFADQRAFVSDAARLFCSRTFRGFEIPLCVPGVAVPVNRATPRRRRVRSCPPVSQTVYDESSSRNSTSTVKLAFRSARLRWRNSSRASSNRLRTSTNGTSGSSSMSRSSL